MNVKSTQVWECEHQIVVHAPARAIWALFSDVASWPRWNAGVAKIELNGLFATGAHFTMTLPDGTAFASHLVEVRPHKSFLDETVLDGLHVFVDHRLEPIDENRTLVVFSLEAFGATCDELGPAISADFPAVLSALAEHAEADATAANGGAPRPITAAGA